jgi:hypothetical protein
VGRNAEREAPSLLALRVATGCGQVHVGLPTQPNRCPTTQRRTVSALRARYLLTFVSVRQKASTKLILRWDHRGKEGHLRGVARPFLGVENYEQLSTGAGEQCDLFAP